MRPRFGHLCFSLSDAGVGKSSSESKQTHHDRTIEIHTLAVHSHTCGTQLVECAPALALVCQCRNQHDTALHYFGHSSVKRHNKDNSNRDER